MSKIYKPNENLIYEKMEGEVIALDMQSGTYYSMQKMAGFVWSLLENEHTVKDIIAFINQNYIVDDQLMAIEVKGFVESLIAANLIKEQVASNKDTKEKVSITNKGYNKPLLETYTDVQDLLTIDPIHDVDEMGWPMPKKDMQN